MRVAPIATCTAGSATTVYSCLSNCGSSATITATWHSSLHDLTDPQLVSAPGFGVVIRQ